MACIETWNWASQHVQTEIKNGRYVSAESALVLAGPPRIDMLEGIDPGVETLGASSVALGQERENNAELFGIGLMSDFNVTQNHPLRRLFEIGSKRSYFIVGRTFTRFQMGRVKFYGPSLLRVLYAYYPLDRILHDAAASALYLYSPRADWGEDNPAQIKAYDAPGYGDDRSKDATGKSNRDFWINFQSQIFSQPLGICVLLRTADDYNYGAFYMQNTYLENHTFNINSDQVMMAEAVTGESDNIRPIQLLSQEETLAAA